MAATHGEFLNKLNTPPDPFVDQNPIRALSTCPSSESNICCVPFTSGGGRWWTSVNCQTPSAYTVASAFRSRLPLNGSRWTDLARPNSSCQRQQPYGLRRYHPERRAKRTRLPNRSLWKMLLRNLVQPSARPEPQRRNCLPFGLRRMG